MKRAYLLSALACLLLSGPLVLAAEADKASTDEAQRCFEDLVDTYMHFEAKAWDEAYKGSLKHNSSFTMKQKTDIAYMRKTALEFRPLWWKSTKSSTGISFAATVWGKTFKANYMPSESLGASGIMDFDENGKPKVVVTWQPHMVDSLKVLGGNAAKIHQMRQGDEAEAIIWHELGHNFITVNFELAQLYELYVKYRILYMSLHEFFADLTALYHCSPPGRKVTMLLRISEVHWNQVNDPHTRGALGIGSFMLAHILSEPEKWPSFRLPTTVPDGEVERKTILYMYEHLDPQYTLEEDRQLRELVGNLVRKQGSAIFRSKGTVPLPNKLEYKITTSEDRDLQIKRDEWVAAELKKAIEKGAVTKVQKTEGHPKRFRLTTGW